MLLMLLFTVPWGKVIIAVVHVHYFGNHPVCFPGNGSFCGFFAHGLYEFDKRPFRMNPVTGYVKVFTFVFECMVDLVSVRYHCAGKILQKFPGMIGTTGGL